MADARVPKVLLEAYGRGAGKAWADGATTVEMRESGLTEVLRMLRKELLSDDAQIAAFKAAGPELSSVEPPSPASLGRALDKATRAAIDFVVKEG